MSKKIAIFIIMVLLVNMTVSAEEYSFLTEPWFIALFVGLAVLPLVVWLIADGLSEADKPDDGIRLASMQTANPEPKKDSDTVIKLLQHVEVGQTKDNNFYAGLHFKF